MKLSSPRASIYFSLIRQIRKNLRRLARYERKADPRLRDKKMVARLRKRITRLAHALNPMARPALASVAGLASLTAVSYETNAQTPQISALTPSTNAIAVALDANLDITFSTAMSSATLNAATIRIFGSQTGFLSTSGTLSGNPAVSFDPTTDFKPGELISVSVTGATSSGGTPLPVPLVYQFYVETLGGTGVFTSSAFGSGSSLGVALGDLDDDDDLDAVIANNSGAQEIWLNNGDGSFTSSAFGSGVSQGVALGDLDGDGDLDAVIANELDNPQEIWLNNGDGSFASSAFGSGASFGVGLGDLDGDGDLDAVIANLNQAQKIWLNAEPPTITGLSPATNAIASAAANIEIAFSTTMSVTTASAANIRIHGSQTGLLSTSGVFSGNPVRSFDPAADFKPGELISVTVTGATSSIGLPLTRATVYNFRAAVSGGTGEFGSSNFGGASTFDVSVGDLDGDGNLDAVLSNFNGPHDVWLGNGDGTFTSSAFGGSVQSNGNALGDLDGDGDLDAIIASVSSGREIWLNNGDGTFSSGTFDGGGNVGKVALGDLDGDGDLDAVFGGTGSSRERLWLNNGDGSFVASTFGDTQNSQDIAVGDLDNDGDLDILVGNYGADRIFLNNGDATFTNMTFGGENTLGLALGDLDGDNFLDAIFARSTAAAAIWLNNGDGTFSSAAFGATGSRDASIGDLDGDGDNDAILARNGAEEIWLNNGDGTFTSRTFGAGGTISGAIGDLDNDGDLDYIAGNYLNTAEQVWLNLPLPVVTTVSPATNANAAPVDANIEITFDQAMDPSAITTATVPTNANLVVYGGQTGYLSTLATLSFSNSDATAVVDPAADFKPGEKIMVTVKDAASALGPAQGQPVVFGFRAAVDGGTALFASSSFGGSVGIGNDVALGDLDGDGDLDAIVAKYSFGPAAAAQDIWLNNGDGVFTSSTFTSSVGLGVELGDLDGDGDLDAVLTGGSMTQIWLNNGDATFASSTLADGGRTVGIADLDGDGDLDFIVGRQGLTHRIWLNNGDATFASNAFGGGQAFDMDLGDLDNDGDIDAVFSNFQSVISNELQHVWLNNGDGAFTSSVFSTAQGDAISLGDLDGDGDLDAVLADRNFGQQLWFNNGDGTFSASTLTSSQARHVNTGDLDGDGDLDIIIMRSGSAQELFINDGSGAFTSSTFSASQAIGFEFGDLDGDGDLDAFGGMFTEPTQVLFNLPPEPTLSSIDPTCVIQNSGPTQVAITGSQFFSTTAQISTLNSSGTPVGQRDLAILSSSATDILVDVPNSALATAGTLTITVSNAIGSTSTTLTVNPAVSVTGANCGCPGVALTYTAEPQVTTATDAWTVNGGTIISGQGTGSVQVVWDQGAAVSLGVARTYLSGCTTAAILNVASKTLIAVLDFAQVATDASVTLAILSNDSGTNISLLSVSDPSNGSASEAGGNVTYTPDVGFTGSDLFSYTIEDDQGCRATGAIVIAVNSAPQTVSLGFNEVQVNGIAGVQGLSGPVATDVSSDGRHVYAVGQFSSSIAVFTRNGGDGSLAFRSAAIQGQNGVDGLSVATDVVVSPDGAHVYATGSGSDGIAVFSRNAGTGDLIYIEAKLDGATDAGGTISGLDRPTAIAISPDGSHVYATGYGANSVVIFRRIPVSGTLVYVGTVTNGSGGVTGLRQALSVAVSPDGAHVYVTGRKDNSVVVFSRNAATGALTFVERQKDGVGGVDGLRGASSVALSADGRHVYATGPQDKAVAVFSRNFSTGALTFIERHKDGAGGVTGLDGAISVRVSPDGATVYVAGETAGAVCVFMRDLTTGELTFEQARVDDSGGVDGLNRIRDVSVSPDSRHVYCVGLFDNALVTFDAE